MYLHVMGFNFACELSNLAAVQGSTREAHGAGIPFEITYITF